MSSVSIHDLSINLATVRQQYTMGQAVDACLAQGITSIAPWRDQVQLTGLAEAAAIVRSNKLRVTGLCRGGMFPAADKAGRAAAIDDNKRAIDEAVALQADCLVLVVGGLPGDSHNISAAREMVADGLAAILPHARASRIPLAIEPLHPMYAADRSCINTLEQALDLCDLLGDGARFARPDDEEWYLREAGKEIDCRIREKNGLPREIFGCRQARAGRARPERAASPAPRWLAKAPLATARPNDLWPASIPRYRPRGS